MLLSRLFIFNAIPSSQWEPILIVRLSLKNLVTIRNLPQATRLDRVLRDYFPQAGRQAIQGFITAGKVQVVQRGGKLAITRYHLEDIQDGTQRVRLWPETGRTHQLRIHLAFLGAPILGDRLYGQQSRPQSHLMLHAYQISLSTFAHSPKRIYTAPLPKHLMSRQQSGKVLKGPNLLCSHLASADNHADKNFIPKP